ncbi:tetraacyldisaccharide 4'-kinase [Pseudaestuariivita rosea]|uniref:tetraacyldisaccharide 4'-kinase n=1 Tax=Pseudaestuariivita rosea TaxID=2763263 RepID=UPI001ABA5D3D|nr:tetraacyldisaccharide 4'-kinase [Pseudaestuariivita rosea]
MKAPLFWFSAPHKPAWQARLLAPLGWLYAQATARRLKKRGTAAACPVICIGNINAGGTGKTPMVIAVVERLKARGLKCICVSRGYGGQMKGPIQVAADHQACDVGDEPLLIAAFTETIVAQDRAAGVRMAEDMGADVIIMDDGFQNPSVVKDISVVVVDAWKGFGNARVIPAGPLREPVEAGLKRADMVLSIGPDRAQDRFAKLWSDRIAIPHIRGRLEPLPTGMPWAGLPCLAFAGIGHPEKFFETLRNMGANVLRGEALKDHQPLTEVLMKRLEIEAQMLNAQLVTTEKDAVRLPDSFRRKVLTVPVRLQIDDWSVFDAAFEEAEQQKSKSTKPS